MKKPDKREIANLFFSAFLIIAYIVCAHFFTDFTTTLDSPLRQIVTVLIYLVFGLLLFYATRVGDGKPVKRFSIMTLIFLVLPTLYIIVASIAAYLPLHNVFSSGTQLTPLSILASIALGYGIPYTFISGFELDYDDDKVKKGDKVLEGGIEADVIAAENNDAQTTQFDEEDEAFMRKYAEMPEAGETAESSEEQNDDNQE